MTQFRTLQRTSQRSLNDSCKQCRLVRSCVQRRGHPRSTLILVKHAQKATDLQLVRANELPSVVSRDATPVSLCHRRVCRNTCRPGGRHRAHPQRALTAARAHSGRRWRTSRRCPAPVQIPRNEASHRRRWMESRLLGSRSGRRRPGDDASWKDRAELARELGRSDARKIFAEHSPSVVTCRFLKHECSSASTTLVASRVAALANITSAREAAAPARTHHPPAPRHCLAQCFFDLRLQDSTLLTGRRWLQKSSLAVQRQSSR